MQSLGAEAFFFQAVNQRVFAELMAKKTVLDTGFHIFIESIQEGFGDKAFIGRL
jgi:hypothetical protein